MKISEDVMDYFYSLCNIPYSLDSNLSANQIRNQINHFQNFKDQFVYAHLIPEAKVVVGNGVKSVLGYNNYVAPVNNFLEIIHPHEFDFVFYAIQEAMKIGYSWSLKPFEYKLNIEYSIRKKDGDYTRIFQECSPIVVDDSGTMMVNLIRCTVIPGNNPKRLSNCWMFTGKETINIKEKYYDLNLTKREKQIIKLIAEGKNSKEISEMLYISKHTVDKHRQNMLLKTSSSNTYELLQFAIQFEII